VDLISTARKHIDEAEWINRNLAALTDSEKAVEQIRILLDLAEDLLRQAKTERAMCQAPAAVLISLRVSPPLVPVARPPS
jgi:cellobiose-specific phosphotransferase system component IIA